MKQKSLFIALSSLLALPAYGASMVLPNPPSSRFGFDVYNQLAQKPGNVFFSPYSVSIALAMTAAGAKGATLAEMLKTLHLENSAGESKDVPPSELMEKGDDKPELTIANRLWAKSGQIYNPEFLKIAETAFAAGLTPLDYAADPEQARQTINKWVEEQTKNKIKDLMPKGSIIRDTDLVLTNAIYFKGSWEKPFSKGATRAETFHPEKGKAGKAPFMHLSEKFGYAENENFQALRLPYKGQDLALTVFLPKKGKSLSKLAAKLTADTYRSLRQDLQTREVVVSLPKFRMEYEQQLQSILPKLGMKLAFDRRKADFSGIRALKSDERLAINVVAHKAFVDVDETGTEAAAATGVGMVAVTAILDPQPPKVFKADHPFFFVIEHVQTGTTLFMGRVSSL